MNLPSKKIVPTIIAFLLAVAGITFAATYTPKPIQKTDVPVPTLSAVSAIDTVSTSSPYSTNTTQSTNRGQGSTNSVNDNTLTHQMALDLFSEYSRAKQSGQSVDPNFAQNLLQNSTNIPDSNFIVYVQNDLHTTSDNSVDALKKYGNAMGSVLNNNKLRSANNEVIIMGTAFETHNRQSLLQIDTIVSSYQKMINGFLKVQVPSDLIPSHLDLLNNYNRVINADKKLKLIFDDPINAFIGAKQYNTAYTALSGVMQSYGTFFTQQGVTFQPTEPGAAFNKLYSQFTTTQ